MYKNSEIIHIIRENNDYKKLDVNKGFKIC